MLPFLDSSVCHWRVPGDIALALSYPVLWYRMYAVGIGGVSTETQILHFLTFFFRYVCYFTDFNISFYNSLAKAWYLCAGAATTVYLLYMRRGLRAFNWTHAIVSATSLVLFASAIITLMPVVAIYCKTLAMQNSDPWIESSIVFAIQEAPWNMSQLIAVGVMIPQLVMLYKGASPGEDAKQPVRLVAGVDVWMWTYVVSVAAFRTFYIPHWIWRYNKERSLQPTPQICAALQLAIIYGFIVATVVKNNRTISMSGTSKPESGEEKASVPLHNTERRDAKVPLPSIVITDMA